MAPVRCFCLVIVLSTSFLPILATAEESTLGAAEYLKLPLIHRNPSASPSDTVAADFQRLSTLRAPIVSAASTGSGQYLVDLHLGTPPQKLQLVADTGSDLVWVRCSACRNCTHRLPGSAYLARHSTTFSPFHCYSRECREAPPPAKPPSCPHRRVHSSCWYEYLYSDGSSTSGLYSHDGVTLNASSGKEVKLPGLNFGCGFSVAGASLNGAKGVLGLGRGPISFASQVGRRFGDKFAYCLLDYTLSPPPTSYLLIGGPRLPPTRRPLSFTPLLTNPLSPTFYYVGIESAAVDGVPLKIDPSVWALDDDGNGGTVIDSGTTLSFLPEPAYKEVLKAFKAKVRLPRVEGPARGLDLCYNVTRADGRRLTLPRRLPKLTLKMVGGGVFAPPASNYFIDVGDGTKCVALQAVKGEEGFAVIGNLMQQGFMFVFDREESRLGFSRTGCS